MKELLKTELGSYTVLTEKTGMEWQTSLYEGSVHKIAPVMRTYSLSVKEAYAEHVRMVTVGKNIQRRRSFTHVDR